MRVLIVGGSGDVGAMITPRLARAHTVTVADRRRPAEGVGLFLEVDVTDPNAMRRAVRQQDAIVYLAMGRKDDVDTVESGVTHFDVSVTGLYVTLQVAADAGVRRIVYASSASIWAHYLDVDHSARPVPDAVDPYGLSKRLGESVCEAACERDGLDVVALRLVGPLPDDQWHASQDPRRSVLTAGSDVAEAFLAALELDSTGFASFLITGDSGRHVLDWSRTERDLGWRPKQVRAVPD